MQTTVSAATPGLVSPPVFDLSRVRKLVERAKPDWDGVRLDAAQQEYVRFLQLCRMYPDRKIAAPEDVDQFWHAHMLDSKSYVRDCDGYFGCYLHHDPCIGVADMADDAQATLRLYREAFQAPPPKLWSGLMTCAGPGKGCGSIH